MSLMPLSTTTGVTRQLDQHLSVPTCGEHLQQYRLKYFSTQGTQRYFLINQFSGFKKSVWFKIMCLFMKIMTVTHPGSDSAAKIQSLNGVLFKNISTEMKKPLGVATSFN